MPKMGESRSAVERRLDEPGMRRALKDPLYGPLASGADTSASGRVCASCEGAEKAAPSGKAVEEKKRWHFLRKSRSENKPS
jgi:hypothetical protein